MCEPRQFYQFREQKATRIVLKAAIISRLPQLFYRSGHPDITHIIKLSRSEGQVNPTLRKQLPHQPPFLEASPPCLYLSASYLRSNVTPIKPMTTSFASA